MGDGEGGCGGLELDKTIITRKGFLEKKTNVLPPDPTTVVILESNMSSRPVLHLYQASSKYSVGYSCYRAETRNSNSNTRRGDNSKSKKAEVVILVCDMSSGPVLHYYQVSSNIRKSARLT